MDRYCPRCSALVENPAAERCLICQLDFATDPPLVSSPEIVREEAEAAVGQHPTKTSGGLGVAAFIAVAVAVLLAIGLAVGVWRAIF